MPEYLAIGLIAACGVLCIAHVAWCCCFEIWKRETRAHLDEARLCNAEFSEAIALLKYGAVDEAIEISKRWEVRAKAND